MSPGVAGIGSPINSINDTKSTQTPFFPNSNPSSNKTPNFSSFVSSLNDSTSFNTSNISTTSDGAVNNSFHSVSESRGSSDKSKVFSNSSSRSRPRPRPRLVKVRKQSVSQHARSKSANDNTNRATDAREAQHQFTSGEFGKFSHVFSESLNSNSNKNESGNSFNFVFGDTKSNMVPVSKLFNHGSGGISKDNGSGKVGDLNFDGLRKFSKLVSDSNTNITNPSSSFSFEVKEPTVNVDRYYAERKEPEKGTKLEFQKHDHADFVFGGADKSSLLNSKVEKKESNDIFVCGAAQTDLQSSLNSKQAETIGSVGKSFSFHNEKSTFHSGKFDNVGFVFGTSKSGSASTAEAKTHESKGNADNFSFDPIGKTNVDGETEHHHSKVDHVFVFGSGSKGSSHSQLGNDVKNPNIETAENCNDYLKGGGNSTDSSSKSMFNFVFGGRSHPGNTFNCPPSKLSDEMQKMNIHDYEIADGAKTSKNSNFSSFANISDKFVFGSDNKSSVSLTGTSAFTSCQFKDADAPDPENGQVVKNLDVVDGKTGERKVAGLGNNNNGGSFGDSVENTIPDTSRNWETRSETGLFSGQNPLYCTSGTRGKENKGIKATENGMDGKRNVGDEASISNGVNEYFCPSSLTGFGYQSFDSSHEAPTGDKDEKKDKEFTFTSTPVHLRPTFTGFSPPQNMPANLFSGGGALNKDTEFTSTNTPVQLGPSFMGFSTPNLNMPANLFPGLCTKLNFSNSKKSVGARRLKKTRGKSRQHTVSKESNSQQNEASLNCGSPMDFSPYEEASCAPSAPHSTIGSEGASEGLAATRERSHAKGDNNWDEENEKCLKDHCIAEPQINPKTERNNNNVSAGTATEARAFHSDTKREEYNGNSQYCSASTSLNHGDQRSSFGASSAQHNTSASTRKRMKKYRMKVGRGSDSTGKSWNSEFESSSVKYFNLSKSSVRSDEFQGQRGDILNTQRGEQTPNAGEKEKKEDLTEAATVEACEKWRIRGNQAYRKGSLSKAENFYTKCIDSITHMKTPECCIEPLLLCYSNRAAARMCLGRIREALRDCTSAAALDSNFWKVQIRAANCHLVLGEVEDAVQYFNKCLESGVDVCLDRRIMIEAADGLQKSQKVTECTNQAAELLQQRTYDAANNALRIIMEALSISCHSEKLLEMKGEALCMLRKYEEVVQLCEQTLGFAEKNFASISNANQLPNTGGSNGDNSDIRLWRWRLMSRSYFHMGRLEASLDLSRQHEQLSSANDKYSSKENDSSVTSAAAVNELLELKNAGNKAFQSGKHTEAVEHYTAAISSSVQSRPFAAVCFCNRAAAHQAMGKLSDAIADCSLAIALDESYGKALSRRATLHEMIRDYEQAANDLQRFINLQKQSKEINNEATDTPMGTSGKRDSFKEARNRLCSVERKAKKGTPLDFYLLLGVKVSDTSSDIKKAYHRAALKHHPDKAGQFLVRTETGDEGPLRKEIVDKIHVDADRLFKMIGEAYAVLSDNSKRAKYDREEDIRKESEHVKYNSSGRESDVYSSPFGTRNNGGVYGGESWKTYGKTRYRW